MLHILRICAGIAITLMGVIGCLISSQILAGPKYRGTVYASAAISLSVLCLGIFLLLPVLVWKVS